MSVFAKLSTPQKIGIVSYGAYIPKNRIRSSTTDTVRGVEPGSTTKTGGLVSKSVPAIDEDSATLAVMSVGQALARLSESAKEKVGSIFVGSESHPYAVKPTGTIVAAALGLPTEVALADLEFACKAGTQGFQIVSAYIKSGMHQLGLAIGADTAQAAPGDALEYTAAAGSAAYVLGSRGILAELHATVSVATDTPDFWRAAGAPYPSHAGRFTGEPAYFAHISMSVERLLQETQLSAKDIDYCVFHTPNLKFPMTIAKRFGFTKEQLSPSLLVQTVGNTYSAASMLALAKTLDSVGAHKKILVASYGSGAGSDAFLLKTTPLLIKKRQAWSESIADQLQEKNLTYFSYSHYLKNTARSH